MSRVHTMVNFKPLITKRRSAKEGRRGNDEGGRGRGYQDVHLR